MRSWARLGRLAGWISLAAAIALGAAVAHTAQPAPPVVHLVIVVDGLRPDYVTPNVMPRLVRLGERGMVFRRASRGISNRDSSERAVVRDRRVSRNARSDGQHHLHPVGQRHEIARHGRSRKSRSRGARRWEAPDGAVARRDSRARREEASRRELGLERIGAAAEPPRPSVRRRDRPHGVRAATRVERARRRQAGAASARRPSERRTQSPCGRCVSDCSGWTTLVLT